MKTPLTLSQAIDGFMFSLNARQLSKHTIRDYLTTLRKLEHFLSGDAQFKKISREQINQFLAAQDVSKKTLYNYHIGLSAFYTWAVREELVEEHILKKIPRSKPEKPAIIPYSEKDIKAMLADLKRSRAYERTGKGTSTNKLKFPERHKAMILLLLDTGIRATELSDLKYHQTDLKNQRILVWGKGAKQRTIPISSATCQAIWRYTTTRDDPDMGDPVFVTEQNRPISSDRLLDILQIIGERAKVSGVTVHRFRHTFAINYLRNGGDVYTLQEILGHTTLEMVKRYLAIAQADVEKAHRKASPVSKWGL